MHIRAGACIFKHKMLEKDNFMLLCYNINTICCDRQIS